MSDGVRSTMPGRGMTPDFGYRPRAADDPWIMLDWDYDLNTIRPTDISLGSRQRMNWICRNCKVRWVATLANRTTGSMNCPNLCYSGWSRPMSISHPEFHEMLISEGVTDVYYDDARPLKWSHAGHIFISKPKNVVVHMTHCGTIRNETNFRVIDSAYDDKLDRVKNDSFIIENISVIAKERVWWLCKNGHSFLRAPRDYIQRTDGLCTECTPIGEFGTLRLDEARPDLKIEWSSNNTKSMHEFAAKANQHAYWLCHRCGCEWKALISNRVDKNSGCPSCWKGNRASRVELRLMKYLEATLGEKMKSNLRLVHKGRVHFPDISTIDDIRIEYDGWYWHRDFEEYDVARHTRLMGISKEVIHVRESPLPLISDMDVSFSGHSEDEHEVFQLVVDKIKSIRQNRPLLVD